MTGDTPPIFCIFFGYSSHVRESHVITSKARKLGSQTSRAGKKIAKDVEILHLQVDEKTFLLLGLSV